LDERVLIPFPEKKYNIIYADPPWKVDAGWDKTYGKSQPLKYPTMDLEEIKNLPIKNISKDNSKLFIWTINKYLPYCFDVIKCWGFNYSTTLLWVKKPKGCGLGGTFSTNAEYLIFAYKGKQNAIKKQIRCWFELPRSEHSKKPNFFRNLIAETYNSNEEKIELFARQKVDGWDCWGNEV
jgi:N6-adenosine-specific RNA methylase IME4